MGQCVVLFEFGRKRTGAFDGGHVREQFGRGFKRQRQDQKIRDERAAARGKRPLRSLFIPRGRFHIGIEQNAPSRDLRGNRQRPA
jgi:hypothetical protein